MNKIFLKQIVRYFLHNLKGFKINVYLVVLSLYKYTFTCFSIQRHYAASTMRIVVKIYFTHNRIFFQFLPS